MCLSYKYKPWRITIKCLNAFSFTSFMFLISISYFPTHNFLRLPKILPIQWNRSQLPISNKSYFWAKKMLQTFHNSLHQYSSLSLRLTNSSYCHSLSDNCLSFLRPTLSSKSLSSFTLMSNIEVVHGPPNSCEIVSTWTFTFLDHFSSPNSSSISQSILISTSSSMHSTFPSKLPSSLSEAQLSTWPSFSS